ncbi:MAG: DUF1919 domain-containing protein [Clostridia bacterium]|nr:DUF1919 domain-containing protein [Clostridia bacterium]
MKNDQCTIISSNCTGGFISHWLGLRFNSPTVNLFIKPKDFIKILENFDYYFDSKTEIYECIDHDKNYPVGEFETGVKLWFMHYTSFEDAVQKWKQRCGRIDKNNLYIIMVERDSCTEEDLLRFDKLPYENKVCLVHKDYNRVQCAYRIPGFEEKNEVGQLHHVCNKVNGKRYLDAFKYVDFLNSNCK